MDSKKPHISDLEGHKQGMICITCVNYANVKAAHSQKICTQLQSAQNQQTSNVINIHEATTYTHGVNPCIDCPRSANSHSGPAQLYNNNYE